MKPPFKTWLLSGSLLSLLVPGCVINSEQAPPEIATEAAERPKTRSDLRRKDIPPIAPAEADQACENDINDPVECHKLAENECRDSKVCSYDPDRERCLRKKQFECMGIDTGCCLGEKRAAVNKKAAAALGKTRDEQCAALLKEEGNKGMCRGRMYYHSGKYERPVCSDKKCELH